MINENTGDKTKKRGALSLEEERFIVDNKDLRTTKEIADHLGRNEEPIKKFLKGKAIEYFKVEKENPDEYILRQKLHDKPWWVEVKKHFSNSEDDGELQFFEKMWVELMKQFKEDVLPTEEVEIKQWITLEILMNRLMKEHKVARDEIKRLQGQLDKEFKKPITTRDVASIELWKVEMMLHHGNISSFNKDHMALLGQIKDMRRDLKMARNDRIKKIEDSKVTWTGLIKMLDEMEYREKQGLEAEILARATDKAKNNLRKEHRYSDDKYDCPLLNSDTLDQLSEMELKQIIPESEEIESPQTSPVPNLLVIESEGIS